MLDFSRTLIFFMPPSGNILFWSVFPSKNTEVLPWAYMHFDELYPLDLRRGHRVKRLRSTSGSIMFIWIKHLFIFELIIVFGMLLAFFIHGHNYIYWLSRCGNNFCASHRYAESHDCTFDYKTEGRKLLEQNNPVVSAPKLPKI